MIVSVAWIAACLLASWVIIRRRDFAGAPIGRRQGSGTPVRAVAALAVVLALLAIVRDLRLLRAVARVRRPGWSGAQIGH
ncbi:MAG: hypothetical protein ABSG43_03280 [Solirubrobacteraceae bacterium]